MRKAAIVRFDEDGSLDSTYGPADTGIVLTDDGAGGPLRGFAVQHAPDDGDYVAGDSGDTGPWALLRYDSDGSLLKTTLTPIGDAGSAHARAILMQPSDNKLVLAGSATDGGADRFALARYTPTGDLDPSFGTAGHVITPIGSTAGAAAISLVLNRELIASGSATMSGTSGFALAGDDMSGTLDPTFGAAGTVLTRSSTPAATLRTQCPARVPRCRRTRTWWW